MAEYISFQPSDYFSTKLYTGTGSSNAITGVGFQSDLTWIKTRNDTQWNVLTDAVRGNTKNIYSNGADAEETNANRIQSWDSDGFTLGTDGTTNGSGDTLVSWNWKAGTTTGIAGSPSITPTSYSFNATSGFSIIKYTGNGVGGATLPHGLGVAPKMIIVKRTNSANNWVVYHRYLGATKHVVLNTTAAENTQTNIWNDTEPGAILFTIGSNDKLNTNTDNYIAYCFAEKTGYSKFGNYEGNANADGPFVYTGFRPAFIIFKGTVLSDWESSDNKRIGYNTANYGLTPNTTAAEATGVILDFLSNGFKLRTANDNWNPAVGQYKLYAAFAAFPLVSSNDIPGTAR